MSDSFIYHINNIFKNKFNNIMRRDCRKECKINCGQKHTRKCGYAFNKFQNEVKSNVKLIGFKNSLGGKPITTVNIQEFPKMGKLLPSKYNPTTMATLTTDINGRSYGISNVEFIKNDKKYTIQFLAVDGNQLSENEFEDSNYVLNKVNQNKLPIISMNPQNPTDKEMANFDAYSGSIWYCKFLFDVFDRIGIVDDNMVFLSVVNINMSNAFWNGFYMTYGNGSDSSDYTDFTSIDVVGHEATHGIIEACGGLTYQGESGALNESIADIFGTCLEKYYDIQSNKNLFDWDMGEDFGKVALRSLENPKLHDQPDTYQGTNWMNTYAEDDNGGVHVNSGVSNYLFYILCNGKASANDFGTRYTIRDTFNMFKLALLIYHTLNGKANYKKISSNCSYMQYCNALYENCNKFIIEEKLDKNLLKSLVEGFVAIGTNKHLNIPSPDSEPDTEYEPEPQPQSEPQPQPQPQPHPEPQPQPEPSDPNNILVHVDFNQSQNIFQLFGNYTFIRGYLSCGFHCMLRTKLIIKDVNNPTIYVTLRNPFGVLSLRIIKECEGGKSTEDKIIYPVVQKNFREVAIPIKLCKYKNNVTIEMCTNGKVDLLQFNMTK